jgi:hypothetical protein
VTVVGVLGQRGVVAIDEIPTGEVVLVVNGVRTARPSRYSIQVGKREHIDLPEGIDPARSAVEYPWQFLNHSCAPNARLVGKTFVAARPIEAGDEITFDYNTTEYDMASPFECRCGASACRGRRIAGFRHLGAAERLALLPFLTDALHARLAQESGVARA